MSATSLTADQAGLMACHSCELLSQIPAQDQHCECPRCGASLYRRKPHSLVRTQALLLASALLYIPANMLPVITVVSMGERSADTILSGVIQLFQDGMWPLGLLVFFASILVPVVKLLVLGYLIRTVQQGAKHRLRERIRIYRWIEGIGRWSMVDIFVLTLVIALVQHGNIATIEAGMGSTIFSAVIVMTMLAANSFDPRLIWDTADES